MKALDNYFYSHAVKDNKQTKFENKRWTDWFVDSEMIFSYRKNYYNRETFTEGLHTHNYFELLFYVKGDVEYIQNDKIVRSEPYTVLCFQPGTMHTARLVSDSEYERYVLYFSKEFFLHENEIVPMLDFIKEKSTFAFCSNTETSEKLYNLFKKTKNIIMSEKPYRRLLAKSFILEIFGLLNSSENDTVAEKTMNDKITIIKNYIDEKYAEINNINEIAGEFFYSREHISREFKRKFNISVSEYLSKRRIMESLKFLPDMTIAEACYSVGFKSQSAYISAFVKNIGCLPGEYKKRKKYKF